jgi:hypothetical protein
VTPREPERTATAVPPWTCRACFALMIGARTSHGLCGECAKAADVLREGGAS